MLQNSRSSSVFENDSKEIQETTSAAAKKNEECLDKDAEILRLIEERRSMYQRKKKSSKVSEIFRESKQQRREFLPIPLENSTKDSTKTVKKTTPNVK